MLSALKVLSEPIKVVYSDIISGFQNGEAVPNPQKIDLKLDQPIKSITVGPKSSGFITSNGDLYVCGKNRGRFSRNLDMQIIEEFTMLSPIQSEQAILGHDFLMILTLSNEILIYSNNEIKKFSPEEKISRIFASENLAILQTDKGEIVKLKVKSETFKPKKLGAFSDIVSVSLQKEHAIVVYN